MTDFEVMRPLRLLPHLLPALGAVLAACTMGWLGLVSYAWNDYEGEASPAVTALAHGHFGRFLQLAPTYGGSLLERAPFALLPGLWGGGALAVYRAVAAPCLIAAVLLALWLAAELRRGGRASRMTRALAIALCVANPITLLALELGHPEELLGAVLCVAAVLCSERGHRGWAAVLLGAAIANKGWAVLAVPAVLLAQPRAAQAAPGVGRKLLYAARQSLPTLAFSGVVAGALMAPFLIAGGGFGASIKGVASTSSTIFKPFQLWWFLGHHGSVVKGSYGIVMPGYRVAPVWLGPLSHPAVVLAGLGMGSAYWWRIKQPRHSAEQRLHSALLLLATTMLLRCMLDTWDTSYYMLPFLLALLTWELTRHGDRPPAISALACGLAWTNFHWIGIGAGADLQAAFFMAWTLPALTLALAALFAPQRLQATIAATGAHLHIRALPDPSAAR